jgi:1-pyrroline-5-carboxylate dehydrogenase
MHDSQTAVADPATAPFRNESFTDFGQPENAAKQEAALMRVREQLGQTHDLWIGGQSTQAAQTFESTNPADPGEVIGVFQKGGAREATLAMDAAATAFESWSRTPAAERSDYLFRAAALMRERRFELNAWMILEVGKSWAEADGDTAEAIDFLEYYGRENLRYAAEQPITPLAGEKNQLSYIPLGVGAIIPPWNFPLAIMAGMTTAAIVTGNTVVLKPSSDAPAICVQFIEILKEIGLPGGVVNLLTGPGSSAGNTLVEHPQTRFIAFTGSREVGLQINELAARPRDGQIWLKRVVAEMGGKDAIIVDDEADLDAAVPGVLASAFGFSGQKCSACSRAIVTAPVYDRFVERLAEKASEIHVGDPTRPDTYIGPVVNEASKKKIMSYIDIGRQEGRLVCGGNAPDSPGYFIEPTIFADIDSRARLGQEEIFGPVLAIIKARDYEHALEIANDTEYGLTGAVYTQNRDKIERARRDFHVGNLYFNRKCTGALVGVHPFGGFNMSGTDSKAGGRDYLLLFLQAKTTSEAIS